MAYEKMVHINRPFKSQLCWLFFIKTNKNRKLIQLMTSQHQKKFIH
jgi:hypothetical protein